MNESTPIENFSTLDSWLPAAPLWRPFRPEAARTQRTMEFADVAAD
jgi:hypothetical protein